MGKVMVIGCGGVAGVAIRKCCANSQVFDEVCIASRTLSKCDALKAELEGRTETKITTAQVDAGNVAELTALIKRKKPQVVLNLALPYQDLTIMEPAWQQKPTMWILPITNRRIRRNLNTNGSGPTGTPTRRQALQPFLEAVLTRE